MYVGLCLSQWESIENHFADIFQTFIDTKSHAAKRAYGSIVSAAGRRDALEAAAEVFFAEWSMIPEVEQKRFMHLLKHFSRATGRRNEIAHGIAKNLGVHIQGRVEGGWFLFPAEYNSNKTSAFAGPDIQNTWSFDLGLYRYTSDDLSHFYSRFGELAQAVEEYIVMLKREHLKQ